MEALKEYNKCRNRHKKNPSLANLEAYNDAKEDMKRARRTDDEGRREMNAKLWGYMTPERSQLYDKLKMKKMIEEQLEKYRKSHRERKRERREDEDCRKMDNERTRRLLRKASENEERRKKLNERARERCKNAKMKAKAAKNDTGS